MSDYTDKEKIIYIYPQLSSFIRKDIQLLAEKYWVISPSHNWTNKKMTVFSFLLQFFYLLKEMPGSNSVFVMFGGYWSFIPSILGKIFRKPVFIILGGTDCVSIPEINYGSLRKTLLRFFIRFSYKLSTRLLPVSEALVETDYTYFPECKYPKQGYHYFFPDMETPYTVVYNGFEKAKWKNVNILKKRNTFITVANIFNRIRYKLKGIDLILKLANAHKDCHFTIIGMNREFLESIGQMPGNISSHEFVPSHQLPTYLNESEFYLQLSISEGFPNALCEGMLCGCIPIGSNVGAIPDIIGNTGIVVNKRDFKLIDEAVNTFISMDISERDKLAKETAKRIDDNFGIAKRKETFFNIIERGS
jgi:glycosyltransferase involved in cell wall biosynthesis|tara:strand:+ start:1591 stop:2673 length:1083 start_codon:yes stop_codon:yes gene_type:complete